MANLGCEKLKNPTRIRLLLLCSGIIVCDQRTHLCTRLLRSIELKWHTRKQNSFIDSLTFLLETTLLLTHDIDLFFFLLLYYLPLISIFSVQYKKCRKYVSNIINKINTIVREKLPFSNCPLFENLSHFDTVKIRSLSFSSLYTYYTFMTLCGTFWGISTKLKCIFTTTIPFILNHNNNCLTPVKSVTSPKY